METQTNWTKKEFQAYLLIYCMHADWDEKDAEKSFIRERVGSAIYDKAHQEFNMDSDYERASKIQASFHALNYGAEEKEVLLSEIKEIFGTDGNFDAVEKSIEVMLGKLLK